MNSDVKYRITKTCDAANKIFIAESLSGYPKYKYLPHWINNKANYLKKERENFNAATNNFKVYDRGNIVYVDFGVNVGYELSGNHFAIVMNNKDNSRNGILEVVPISSKDKSSYISVGRIIEMQSIKHFISQYDKLDLELKYLITALCEKKLMDETKLDDNIRQILDSGIKVTVEESLTRLEEFGIDWNDPTTINAKMLSLSNDSQAYRKVFMSYRNYTKSSYAMPLNMQSISKLRIKRINKYDPAGKIKAPAEVMNKIDTAILKNYTKL